MESLKKGIMTYIIDFQREQEGDCQVGKHSRRNDRWKWEEETQEREGDIQNKGWYWKGEQQATMRGI